MPDRSLYIDLTTEEVVVDNAVRCPLYSPEGFRILSDLWLKVGWDQKHVYSFAWLGRPIIQLPDDAFRIQEVIYSVKPDVIIETGVAHGGSLIFYASICKAIGKGKVIGVDIEIRPPNRRAIEAHELFELITLIEGDSTSDEAFQRVRQTVSKTNTVLVILDSNHTYRHVLRELDLYAPLVTLNSYIVATDGSQEYLNITPRAKREYPASGDWPTDNPKRAAEDFARRNPKYRIVEPAFPFNEGYINFRVTHWPSAFIQRVER